MDTGRRAHGRAPRPRPGTGRRAQKDGSRQGVPAEGQEPGEDTAAPHGEGLPLPAGPRLAGTWKASAQGPPPPSSAPPSCVTLASPLPSLSLEIGESMEQLRLLFAAACTWGPSSSRVPGPQEGRLRQATGRAPGGPPATTGPSAAPLSTGQRPRAHLERSQQPFLRGRPGGCRPAQGAPGTTDAQAQSPPSTAQPGGTQCRPSVGGGGHSCDRHRGEGLGRPGAGAVPSAKGWGSRPEPLLSTSSCRGHPLGWVASTKDPVPGPGGQQIKPQPSA